MKKILALALALVLVLVLVACGQPADSTPSGDIDAEQATTENVPQTEDEGENEAAIGPGVYTFEDYKADMDITIVWSLTLRVDGTFYLEENNPFVGATEHTGESYTVEGNTVKLVGLEPFEKSDIFNVSELTVVCNEAHFAPEGYELAEVASEHLSDYVAVPGTYTYEAYKADFDFSIYWTLVLKEDGTFTLTEDNSMIGALEEHAGASYTVDGDMVYCEGLEPFPMDDVFKNSSFVLYCCEDMTFFPKGAEAGGSSEKEEESFSVSAAQYTFEDHKEDMNITIVWTLDLKEDGTFTLTEENPFKGETVHSGASYTVEGDTVKCEGLEPFEMSDIFGVDSFTAKCNEKHFAPEGYELAEVVVAPVIATYTFDEEKADTGIILTWTLELREDGTYTLTEINPNFADPKVYEGTEYVLDGNNLTCGKMVNPPAMGDWAVQPDGFTATIDGDTFTPDYPA